MHSSLILSLKQTFRIFLGYFFSYFEANNTIYINARNDKLQQKDKILNIYK